jgi:hypothetical protein
MSIGIGRKGEPFGGKGVSGVMDIEEARLGRIAARSQGDLISQRSGPDDVAPRGNSPQQFT